jgi:hypothetical protein
LANDGVTNLPNIWLSKLIYPESRNPVVWIWDESRGLDQRLGATEMSGVKNESRQLVEVGAARLARKFIRSRVKCLE